jgi:hypothetical protein
MRLVRMEMREGGIVTVLEVRTGKATMTDG